MPMKWKNAFALLLVLPSLVRANIATDWTEVMLDAIRVDNSAPTLASRNLAILQISVYDAVNSLVRTHQPYHSQLDAPAGTSPEATVAGAAHEILIALYPPVRARADSQLEDDLARLGSADAVRDGVALGREVARRMLALREADGANTQVPYIPSDAPGQWRRTAPFFRPPTDPHWRFVRLFGVPATAPFVAAPPPGLDSAAYADAFNEVKSVGIRGSTNRTAYETQTAVFWSDFSFTATPPGHFNEITCSIIRDRGLSLPESVRLLALVGMSQADAGIVCWEGKYRYNTWRPITAIHRADEDANPATEPNPDWDHQLISPPFPEYPSGHSTFSKASSRILTLFFGTDALTFSTGSDSIPGVFRTYTSLAACADEVGQSRVLGGIHFQFANQGGKESGRKIANHNFANLLLPLEQLPIVRLERFTGGTAELLVHANFGVPTVLETSADLARWTPIVTNFGIRGGWSATNAAATAAQFYRAVTMAP
jgi:membrane-associated phospholipid phosphatase